MTGAIDDMLAAAPPGDERPISELLSHVGNELRALCAAAYDLEAAVGALISSPETGRGEGLRGLQELDRLIQHIDGLADYLSALADASRDLGAVDATEARKLIKIARLAEGLAGRISQQVGDSGEVEFL